MNIRKATYLDAYAIARVNVDTWRTTYHGILPDAYIDKLTYLNREKFFLDLLKKQEDNTFIYVVECDNDGIIGFAVGGPERSMNPVYSGELHTIYIQRNFQGKGIGTLLVGAITRQLYEKGLSSMLVWVLSENPFLSFYESLNGSRVDSKTIKINGENHLVIAYGWKNIKDLIRI